MPHHSDRGLASVPAPLHRRLPLIDEQSFADWHPHHVIGTALSDIAQSFWHLQPKGWTVHYVNLLNIALEQFRRARELVPEGANETLRLQIIRCEEIIAEARLAREYLVGEPPTSASFIGVLERLHRLHGDNPKHCPDAWHQTAIAYSLSTQISWGQRLGYVGWADEGYATDLFNGAVDMFTQEAAQTPDKERAYRTLMINMALAYDSLKRTRIRRHYAAAAMRSARRHRDYAMYQRASAVYLAGHKGEVLWHRLYNGRTLRAFR
jgi:hypothetical protein